MERFKPTRRLVAIPENSGEFAHSRASDFLRAWYTVDSAPRRVKSPARPLRLETYVQNGYCMQVLRDLVDRGIVRVQDACIFINGI